MTNQIHIIEETDLVPSFVYYLLIASCLASGYAGTYSYFKRKMPGHKSGGLLILLGSFWTLIYNLQIYSRQVETIFFFYKIQALLGYFIPTLFTLYIINYFELHLNKRNQFILGINLPPIIAAIQIMVNDPFNLMWDNISFLNYNQVLPTLGPYSFFMIMYNYLIIIIMLGYFIYTLIKPQQILKIRILAFFIAVIIYSITYAVDILGETPHYFIFSPFIFNLLSSSIMLMNPERMYKKDVLPVVYNIVIEKMSNPVFVTDRNDKIMFVNTSGKKLVGLEEFSFLQKELWDVFKDLYQYFSGGIGENDYFEFGDSIFQVGVYSIEDWRKVNRCKVYVLDNVTEVVDRSRGLEVLVDEKSEELMESERLAEIGKVTSMVGHDLRNPLQIIRSIGEKLEERYVDEYNVFELISRTNKNVLYMDKIVYDLQLLAKERVPARREVRLCELVEESLIALDMPTGVDFVFSGSDDFSVFLDVNMFVRVLVNLLTNAVQAMPDGGNIWVDCLREDGFDVISVGDSGEGINEEDQSNMFKPFFTTKAKGMGLGLSVCKKVVENHGGEIWVESEQGKGAVFYIKIPSKDGIEKGFVGVETVEILQNQA